MLQNTIRELFEKQLAFKIELCRKIKIFKSFIMILVEMKIIFKICIF